MPEPSSEQVRLAQSGDPAALRDLIAGQQQYVYSIAMNLLRNPHDAADATQDAFIRMMRSLGTYRGETRFTTWLYRLVTNICLDQLRRKARGATSLDAAWADDQEGTRGDLVPDLDPEVQPALQAERGESAAEVRDALLRLQAPQRLALSLLYLEDQSYEEIAAIMGLPLNTVKSHIRRGKERLALLLADPRDTIGGAA